MDPREFLRTSAPWLLAPEFGACIVGSQALAIACRGAKIDGPNPSDVDLAWALDPEAGKSLLEQHQVLVPTTTGNQERGTLAAKIGGQRIEITTFRSSNTTDPIHERMIADLAERDMTIGAIAIDLSNDQVHDPHGGLQHYQDGRIVPVGDPLDRVREHGIRWLRYFRKAHELGFVVDNSIRDLHDRLDPEILLSLPKEAVSLELRAILTNTASPGRCLLELQEVGLLATLSPELSGQFDGRPAGPQRWHPEVSQGLHLILALEWAVQHTAHLDNRDRSAVLFSVMCHDFGKSDTNPDDFPRHHGHENAGVKHIESLAARWPGLMDQRTTTLAKHVSALHLQVRQFHELRPGTRARLYEDYFRPKDYPIEPFALAVAADSAGRLGFENDGPKVRDRIIRDLKQLRTACTTVDAGALKEAFPNDLDAFRAALHQARTRAVKDADQS